MQICPKCLAPVQVDHGCDYVACPGCNYAGEPVEVPFNSEGTMEEFRRNRDGLVALERFKLVQIEREGAFILAERRWYENLSVADRFWEDSHRKRDRDEWRRERMAGASPIERLTMELQDTWSGEFARQLFADTSLLAALTKGPATDALDTWLAEDGRMPEVRKIFA